MGRPRKRGRKKKKANLSPLTRLYHRVHMSLLAKKRWKWSRENGAGFIKEDINAVMIEDDKTITLELFDKEYPHIQTFSINDLNLRETEELLACIVEMMEARDGNNL